MTRDELKAALGDLIGQIGEARDVQPAKAVLHTLWGALAAGDDEALQRLCTSFSREMVAVIDGIRRRRN